MHLIEETGGGKEVRYGQCGKETKMMSWEPKSIFQALHALIFTEIQIHFFVCRGPQIKNNLLVVSGLCANNLQEEKKIEHCSHRLK